MNQGEVAGACYTTGNLFRLAGRGGSRSIPELLCAGCSAMLLDIGSGFPRYVLIERLHRLKVLNSSRGIVVVLVDTRPFCFLLGGRTYISSCAPRLVKRPRCSPWSTSLLYPVRDAPPGWIMPTGDHSDWEALGHSSVPAGRDKTVVRDPVLGLFMIPSSRSRCLQTRADLTVREVRQLVVRVCNL